MKAFLYTYTGCNENDNKNENKNGVSSWQSAVTKEFSNGNTWASGKRNIYFTSSKVMSKMRVEKALMAPAEREP